MRSPKEIMKSRAWWIVLGLTLCGRIEWETAGQTPFLTMDRHQGHPRVTWTATFGESYRLLTSERLGTADWTSRVTLTADNDRLSWADEMTDQPMLFYRLATTTETNWTLTLQNALAQRSRAGLVGVTAVVITPTEVWQGISGFSETNAPTILQPQMRFSIASVTKTFTASLIMLLAEEGKLTLDDPIDKWLPARSNITSTATIRQLLGHTSGIHNFTENPEFLTLLKTPDAQFTAADALALVQAPYFDPGGGFHYSNTGYLLLGQIAEAVAQDTVDAQFRTRFLQPLGLPSIYLEGAEPGTGERAHGHSSFYTGTTEDITVDPVWRVGYPLAWTAGAMTATAYDLARWLRALYGGNVVSEESLSQMTAWYSASTKYGLGTERIVSRLGEFWGHGGTITGYCVMAGHCPERDLTMVVLANQEGDISLIWNLLVTALSRLD
jgi:D-alanyl-D-alanine carboxypeptidase